MLLNVETLTHQYYVTCGLFGWVQFVCEMSVNNSLCNTIEQKEIKSFALHLFCVFECLIKIIKVDLKTTENHFHPISLTSTGS